MTGRSLGSVFRSAVLLTVVIAAGWAVCFWPARVLRGSSAVWWMSVAAVACLVPGWFVLLLSRLSVFPNDLAAMLAQTLLRLGSVAAVALAVRMARPHLGIMDFFGWLIGFYLMALVTEVWMLRRAVSKPRSGDEVE